MKEARCSLLLPENGKYQPKIKNLHKQKVIVYQDTAAEPSVGLPGGKPFYAEFQGSTVMQLEPSPKVKHKTMPITLTVGGRCTLTKENYRDFGMMMRTKDQADTIHVDANGSFDWPDVESFLMCPVCSESAPIPDDDSDPTAEYWLLFYPLLQINIEKGDKMIIASRTICRLACFDCMENLLEGMQLTVKQTPTEADPSLTTISLSAMEMLEEAGTASFLQDSPPRPESFPNVDDELDAWTLYTLWEHSGAWEALQNDYKTVLSRSMQATSTLKTVAAAAEITVPSSSDKAISAIRAKERYGRKCGSSTCNKVHGKKDEETGEVMRLTVVCEKCQSVYYCSKTCRKAAAKQHRGSCAQNKEEERERHVSRLKKIQCDVCKKVLPCTQM
eukprot:CAMPEP_0119017644 /NCGR_PEP_ID=MMETSP1176-20130426/17214_1 /TAXON_ID=265551 /ORGANISM="Synedropsis recta cf, Strain CCMP1620" /LENGTH=387 /DNA_ID=CAMNT_0006971421 /DNA_START=30 /DNA_END=1190 /DNA_ORIENTATION=-